MGRLVRRLAAAGGALVLCLLAAGGSAQGEEAGLSADWVAFEPGDVKLPTGLALDGHSFLKLGNPAMLKRLAREADGPIEISLPFPGGRIDQFRVRRHQVLGKGAGAVSSFAGHSVSEPGTTVRLSVGPSGLAAYVFRGEDVFVVRELRKGSGPFAVAREDPVLAGRKSTCFAKVTASKPKPLRVHRHGDQIDVLRVAVICTRDFIELRGGPDKAREAVSIVFNRVNRIYERDVAVRFKLVYVSADKANDPFDKDATLRAIARAAPGEFSKLRVDHEIGHVLAGRGSGGWAEGGAVSSTDDSTDAYLPGFVRTVAHEIGHQLGATHTFNSDTGNCSGQRRGDTAYEPGAGRTLMAYPGACGELRLAPGMYFHAESILQIRAGVDAMDKPDKPRNELNVAPGMRIGPGFTVPAKTPYYLEPELVHDGNYHPLSTCWEQVDRGTVASPLTPSDEIDHKVPLVWSVAPRGGCTSRPRRYVPDLGRLLDGSTRGEKLSTKTRDMTFALTVRDGRGGVAIGKVRVKVDARAGPFRVSARYRRPQSGQLLVEWDVAGTKEILGCRNVVIYLVQRNGSREMFRLPIKRTENDGRELCRLPDIKTKNAFIMVMAAKHRFFAVSKRFEIRPAEATVMVVPKDAARDKNGWIRLLRATPADACIGLGNVPGLAEAAGELKIEYRKEASPGALTRALAALREAAARRGDSVHVLVVADKTFRAWDKAQVQPQPGRMATLTYASEQRHAYRMDTDAEGAFGFDLVEEGRK